MLTPLNKAVEFVQELCRREGLFELNLDQGPADYLLLGL